MGTNLRVAAIVAAERCIAAARELVVPSRLLRPMCEFDPSEPAILHDRRSNRAIPWSPDFEWEFKRHARQHAPGVIAFEGLLLDGWAAIGNDVPN